MLAARPGALRRPTPVFDRRLYEYDGRSLHILRGALSALLLGHLFESPLSRVRPLCGRPSITLRRSDGAMARWLAGGQYRWQYRQRRRQCHRRRIAWDLEVAPLRWRPSWAMRRPGGGGGTDGSPATVARRRRRQQWCSGSVNREAFCGTCDPTVAPPVLVFAASTTAISIASTAKAPIPPSSRPPPPTLQGTPTCSDASEGVNVLLSLLRI